MTDIIDINKYSWDYKGYEIKGYLKSIDLFIKDAEDCLSFLDTGECSSEDAHKDIDNALKLLLAIKDIENETIKDYGNILNSQIDIMDIDEYHGLRTTIREANKLITDNIEKHIEPEIELLINIRNNIDKKRNTADILKLIDKIHIPNYDAISLLKPEVFILPEELVV